MSERVFERANDRASSSAHWCTGIDRPLRVESRCTSDDLTLAGGLLIDGTGAPPRRADVQISGDRIVAVGDDLVSSTAR